MAEKTTKKGRGLRVALILTAVMAVIALGVWIDYRGALTRPLVEGETRVVVIPKGAGVQGIIDILEEEGLINRPNYLRFYLWRNEKSRRLKPGVYAVDGETTLEALIDRMAEGKTAKGFQVTIPEGRNIYEIAALLERRDLVDAEAFVARATDPAFAATLGVEADSLEGYLFPARYPIAPGTSAEGILRQMHERFMQSWRALQSEHADAFARLKTELDMDPHDVLTLASIVEEEAVLPRERGVIARVFFNRMRIGMKLETDPTCVYPPLTPGEKASPGRCRDAESVYSTYVIEGLPPGPISNMGEAAIEAVLDPYDGPNAEEYLYFAARWRVDTESHYFSATMEEHQQAVDYYLKKLERAPEPSATPQP